MYGYMGECACIYFLALSADHSDGDRDTANLKELE